MIQKKGWLLREIAGVSYLLPYGQQIADHKLGISLNETGVLLWNLLAEEQTEDSLLAHMLAYYETQPEDALPMRQDLKDFLNQLIALGMIDVGEPTHTVKVSACKHLMIGGLYIWFVGPSPIFDKAFQPFMVTDSVRMDQTICVHMEAPAAIKPGTLLLRNQELTVYDCNDSYLLIFPQEPQILGCYLTKDGTQADFYCMLPYTHSLSTNLFHAIRFCFLYLAQKHHMVALHSASILYRGKAWLFSGRSGTGKSTHTNLWKELLQVPVINGDLNLISTNETKPVIHGIPWCGTSGISDTRSYPLGGIVLLKQDFRDYCIPLSADQKELYVMQRLISPVLTEDMFDDNLDIVRQLIPQIPVFRLACTKEPSAVYTIKGAIDQIPDA